MDDQNNIPHFDKSKFTNQPYVKKVEKPWGYELHWVPADKPYMGKIEHLNAGARMSLQIHDQKQESWFHQRQIQQRCGMIEDIIFPQLEELVS